MADQTKDRILDAAERLFAEHGVAATSLRAVMKEAGANMAAIHYHFGSRAGLMEALLTRRAEPVNRRRLEMLDALERRHPDGLLPAEGVVRAFCTPALEMLADPARRHVSKLIGRIAMEAESPEMLGRVFGATARRFVAAIRRAAPHLTEQEALGRLHFIVGTMVFTLVMQRSPLCDPSVPGAPQPLGDQLISFVAAGLAAPSPAESGKDRP
jgi:AcrR family transcriptional regulator